MQGFPFFPFDIHVLCALLIVCVHYDAENVSCGKYQFSARPNLADYRISTYADGNRPSVIPMY